MRRRIEPHEISDLMAAAAAGPVETQKIFDRAYEQDCETFARVLAAAPDEPLHSIVLGLAPARPRAGSQELGFRIQVEVRKSTEGSVRVVPLNLSFDRRYGTTATNSSRLHLTVEQVPAGREGGTDA
jgi:hypothetical protein